MSRKQIILVFLGLAACAIALLKFWSTAPIEFRIASDSATLMQVNPNKPSGVLKSFTRVGEPDPQNPLLGRWIWGIATPDVPSSSASEETLVFGTNGTVQWTKKEMAHGTLTEESSQEGRWIQDGSRILSSF